MSEGDSKSRIDGVMDGTPVQNEDIDWKTKYLNLENSIRADEGRTKKLSDELKAVKAELEKERESKASEELVSELSDDERAGIPEEVIQATAKMVRKVQNDSDRRLREMEERHSAEADADRKSRIERFIEQRFPNFFNDVGPGGDKAKAWSDFRRYNGDSIRSAMASGDIDSVEYHISRFYSDHLGVPVPSGNGGSATPDPRTFGGGNVSASAVSGKTYTQDEYNNLFDMKEAARDRGDWSEVKRITDEINRAEAEGRVSKE